jgi:predicted nucleotidyltransferase
MLARQIQICVRVSVKLPFVFLQFRKGLLYTVAEDFVNSRLAKIVGVVGVLLVGSAAFGCAGRSSDVDLEVFVTEELYQKVGTTVEGFESYRGTDVSWEWMTIEELRDVLRDWKNDVDLWVYQKSRILYDPKRYLKSLLAGYKRYPKKVWREKLFLYWYYATGNAPYDSRRALQRNDLMTAQLCLTQAIEYYTALIFLLNERFIPYRKWRFKELEKLAYRPENYEESFQRILTTTAWTRKEFETKQSIINSLVSELESRLQKAGISEERLKNPWKFKVTLAPRI